MADLTAGFETGTLGNDVLVADTGNADAWDARVMAGASALTYDNAHVAFGALAAKMVADGSGGSRIVWSTAFGTQTDHYGRMYLYLTANPASSFPIIMCSDDGANRVARVDIVTDGKIRIIDAPASGDQTGTVAISLNQLTRLEWHIIHSATVGQIEVKIFNTADSTTPSETITSPATWNTHANGTSIWFGNPQAGGAYTYWFDSVIANATSYPGPVPAAVPTFLPAQPSLRW